MASPSPRATDTSEEKSDVRKDFHNSFDYNRISHIVLSGIEKRLKAAGSDSDLQSTVFPSTAFFSPSTPYHMERSKANRG
jgi:hypothetical protein